MLRYRLAFTVRSVKWDRRLTVFLVTLAPIVVWSLIQPFDMLTWWLEIAPAALAIPVILATQRRFPLSTLLLILVWLHSVLLLVGGHYTYARVPLGYWMSDWFGWPRNNYDKLGHFMQGFVPAIAARELLCRTSPLGDIGGGKRSGWLFFLVLSVCMAISAWYELLEWLAAIANGAATEDFLGTQGYAWDTQTDMALCFAGATAALLFLSRVHDRGMDAILSHANLSQPAASTPSEGN